MGGRGASSLFGGKSGLDPNDIVSTTSLISEREGKKQEVDNTLKVLKYVEERYGVVVEDALIAELKGEAAFETYAYYDPQGNVAVNVKYFDNDLIERAYDANVREKYHPPRGNKTAMEAVIAHEMGHRLTEIAGVNAGLGSWKLDSISNQIMKSAKRRVGKYSRVSTLRGKISGYAATNNSEAVAEAFADVYLNGRKAKRESKAVVQELNKYFGR